MNTIENHQRDLGWVRYVGWGGAVALILLPLVAMRLAPDAGVNWTLSDFVFAAGLIGTVGLVVELAMRAARNWAQRLGALTAIGTGFLLVWSDLAVGYIGDGSSPLNIALLAIPPLVLIGALAVRMRAKPMAVLLTAAAAAHGVTGAIGYPQDPVTGPITAVFVALWLGAAWLFHRSAR
ncbi:hypothetical protein G7078_01570 [Sphingomonas sinipercae]|uniref:Uncharacterized protein n=1 Tax=Sphingomonas sinipercae TaxID=2714944 RepID=A0A6G7ZKT4_9SPHN|nr:hypothetical protein [Sphingomonas sinipercae]QIL01607.1 hypothetical protein G7078_01570 [Sphingomonas sinipercae]